jgi:branched-chain amino acid transport system ATP-binding protein
MRILEVVGLTKRFAGRAALDALSFTAEEGGAVGLFGPAGAGKTTCLHCLSGFVAPDAGRVIFDGRDVTGLPPHRLARAGIAWTFQTARPFRHLSAVENVMLAVAHGLAQGVAALLGVWRGRRVRARALELLERVALSPDADTKAGLLPVSRLKRLEVARALALEPRLILLDEPLGGLPTEELPAACQLIADLRASGLTVILVERQLRPALSLVERAVVLDQGVLVASGPPARVRAHPRVVEVYPDAGPLPAHLGERPPSPAARRRPG